MIAAQQFRDRLGRDARTTGSPLEPLVAHFAMARLLLPLMRPPHADRFALKGALLLTVWHGEPIRATYGLDLHALQPSDQGRTLEIISEVCETATECSNGLSFDIPETSPSPISGGERVTVPVSLGTTKVSLFINVTFGHPVIPSFEWRLLSCFFREHAPVRIRCYPMATVIAEKLAMIVEFDAANTQLVHLFDVWFLSRRYNFHGHDLQSAIEQTFEQRMAGRVLDRSDDHWQTGLTPKFVTPRTIALWRDCLDAVAAGLPRLPLNDVIRDVAAFAMPLLSAIRDHTLVPPRWHPGTGWQALPCCTRRGS
jgi:hypothetical protein